LTEKLLTYGTGGAPAKAPSRRSDAIIADCVKGYGSARWCTNRQSKVFQNEVNLDFARMGHEKTSKSSTAPRIVSTTPSLQLMRSSRLAVPLGQDVAFHQ